MRQQTSILITTFLLSLPAGFARAQVNSEKYQGMLLVGEFGEICTMCEAVLWCSADENQPVITEIPANGSFTVYHLQTRTFWSQVATIWEWFAANFDTESLAQGHERPVDIYAVKEGEWAAPVRLTAHIALEPPLLAFGDHLIDRADNSWIAASDKHRVGSCQRLPLWDALDVIDAQNQIDQAP